MTSSIVKDGIKVSKIIDVFNDYDFIQPNKKYQGLSYGQYISFNNGSYIYNNTLLNDIDDTKPIYIKLSMNDLNNNGGGMEWRSSTMSLSLPEADIDNDERDIIFDFGGLFKIIGTSYYYQLSSGSLNTTGSGIQVIKLK